MSTNARSANMESHPNVIEYHRALLNSKEKDR